MPNATTLELAGIGTFLFDPLGAEYRKREAGEVGLKAV